MKAYKGQPLPFGQLQLEIHADRQPGVVDEDRFTEFLKWWEELEHAGLRPFWTEPNLVFVNINRGAPPALAEVSLNTFQATRDYHLMILANIHFSIHSSMSKLITTFSIDGSTCHFVCF